MSNNENEVLKLTVQEAVETLLMSQSSVYSWIERGKLKTEELPSGKVIVISKKEVENIKECNLKSRRNRVSKQNTQNSDNLQENPVIDVEFSTNYEEKLNNFEQEQTGVYSEGSVAGGTLFSGNSGSALEIAKMISELSSKAGKYELLADLQKENKENAEFWKNEFFRLQAENNELKAENLVLKRDLQNAKRPLFGFSKRNNG